MRKLVYWKGVQLLTDQVRSRMKTDFRIPEDVIKDVVAEKFIDITFEEAQAILQYGSSKVRYDEIEHLDEWDDAVKRAAIGVLMKDVLSEIKSPPEKGEGFDRDLTVYRKRPGQDKEEKGGN